MKKIRKHREYKLIHIILGLAIGFSMGGAVVYLGFNRQNVSLTNIDFSSFQFSEDIYPDKTFSAGPADPDMDEELDKKTDSSKKTKSILQQHSTDEINEEINVESLSDSDTIAVFFRQEEDVAKPSRERHDLYFMSDTLDFIFDQSEMETEDIYVAKDRRLHVKKVQNPRPSEQEPSRYPELDSILGKSASHYDTSTIFIEFWETPLQSKGYLKGKNKIILYGITLHNFVSLKYYNNVVYLKYLNQYYPLEFTSEFKSLKPVSDLALIEELQNL